MCMSVVREFLFLLFIYGVEAANAVSLTFLFLFFFASVQFLSSLEVFFTVYTKRHTLDLNYTQNRICNTHDKTHTHINTHQNNH